MTGQFIRKKTISRDKLWVSTKFLPNILDECSPEDYERVIEVNLINILEKDFGYKGVKVNLITSNATKWRNIRKRAKELELYKNEQIMKINSQLGGVKNWFVNDLVSRWAKKWSVKNLECFQEISPVLEIVQEG